MIVRKIKPEELKRTGELFAIAFEYEIDNSKTAQEVFEEISSVPKSREDFYWKERWAAFEDDDKTMMSCFVAKPFPIQFDGNQCTMVGIGGVSTLPQYRRMGGIRACFNKALPDMYEQGAAFSYLHPFSTAYYRKFGYELCCERTRYQISLSDIRPFAAEGSCYLAEQGNLMVEDIKRIYKVWQNKYNMMVINENWEYAWALSSNPPKDQTFTYVYRDKTGEPKAFMSFKKEELGNELNIRCFRFFFTDPEGLKGLLNLLHSLESDHHYVYFDLPTDLEITPLLPEWSMGAGKREEVFWGMARAVNVEKVLRMAKYRGDGSLIMQIKDDFIPQNNGGFFVRFESGRAAEVHPVDQKADISLGINDFSRMIIGVCDVSDTLFMDSVRIDCDLEKISKVFYKKPVHLTEYF